MNIWALRKKLIAPSTADQPAANVQLPTKALEIPCAKAGQTSEPVLSTPIGSEPIGLNDLFEMTDSQLHQISPKNTFSQLKVFRTSEKPADEGAAALVVLKTAEICRISATIPGDRTALNAAVGLDDLLTMDQEQVEQLFR